MTACRVPIARRGFTFLELILAMSMAAMLALTLHMSMNIAFRSRNIVTNQTEAPRQAAIALDLISDDFQAALVPTSKMSSPFVGQSSASAGAAISFSRCAASGVPRLVLLETRTDGGSTAIVREESPGALSATSAQAVTSARLLRNVRSFGVRYYDGTDWIDSWNSDDYEGKLPPAVEVSVELMQPDPTDPRHGYRMSRIIPLTHDTLAPNSNPGPP
jgi:prepilin-type N-terminal cleavage/methylation domain-containing protein